MLGIPSVDRFQRLEAGFGAEVIEREFDPPHALLYRQGGELGSFG